MDYFLWFRYGSNYPCRRVVSPKYSTIRRCEPYVPITVEKCYKKFADFFLVPILMAVFSLTSIFSELGNGACFALVPHFPHNVRCLFNFRCWS